MTDINKIIIGGKIVRDLDEKSFSYVGANIAKADISLAVHRSKKSGEEWVNDVSYFEVTVWGKTVENLRHKFVKGQQILVEGFLKQDRWVKDGVKKSKVYITAENVQLMNPPKVSVEEDPNGDDPNTIRETATIKSARPSYSAGQQLKQSELTLDPANPDIIF